TLTDSKGKEYTGRQWVDEDETNFVRKLESELDKVFTKKTVKSLEITRRIQVAERDVQDVISLLNDRGSGDRGPGEEEFEGLEQVLSDIITDVHDLAKFVQVNYTGFYKIVKKHDVSLVSPRITIHYPAGRLTSVPLENDGMAHSPRVRHPTHGEALLQGGLRLVRREALQAL
ncbi:hypothetical protein IMZ48_09390, partial [Candidatus Bathyarchaeota archaeon]|nr:hypothetical protein [Candidatus Bathyarchaeota archaeon]